MFSPNLSTVNGGVYAHQAIIFLSAHIPTVDRGALPQQTLNGAACLLYTCGRSVVRAHARYKGHSKHHVFDGALPQKNERNEWNFFTLNEGGRRDVT